MKPNTFPKLTLPDPSSNDAPTLGHRLVDDYLESVHARLRPNSTLAVVYDLKVFFTVIDVDPLDVRRRPRPRVHPSAADRLEQRDGGPDRPVGRAGISTIRRRLSIVAGFYPHLSRSANSITARSSGACRCVLRWTA